MAVKNVFSILAIAACLWPSPGFGAWSDFTAGRPWVHLPAGKDFYSSGPNWVVVQDRLGRLLVGGDHFEVFDGQSWRSYPVGQSQYLTAIAPGSNDRIWVGATNEIGYMEEPTLGNFVFHSLTGQLPEAERNFGLVWGCAIVGPNVYFITRDHVLRWDGQRIQSWNFPTSSRLFFLQLGDQAWFHHVESGLYRLAEEGPVQGYPSTALPASGILGLDQDAHGLIAVSGKGFHRIAAAPEQIFSAELNSYLEQYRVTCVRKLPDGGYVVGTVSGGLVIVTPEGKLARTIRTSDGLPSDSIMSMLPGRDGHFWVAAMSGLFSVEIAGHVTLFDQPGDGSVATVKRVRATRAGVFASTAQGVFQIIPAAPPESARLAKVEELSRGYITFTAWKDGVLLARLGGVDYFDGRSLQVGQSVPALNISLVESGPSEDNPVYAVSDHFLATVDTSAAGALALHRLADLSDPCSSLVSDAQRRVWVGTSSKGIIRYDPSSGQQEAVIDPETRLPFVGAGFVARWGDALLLNADRKAFVVRAGKADSLERIAAFPLAQAVEATGGLDGRLVVLFNRDAGEAARPTQGIGALTLHGGAVTFEEYDVPILAQNGFAHSLTLSREQDRDVLWLGGAHGPVRIDLAELRPLARPDTPLIRLDLRNSGAMSDARANAFHFEDSRMNFRVFPGDPIHTEGWLLEQRLVRDKGAWSAPSNRRSYEFGNLSEGDYRFEVRAVNGAGLRSEPAVFTFRVMPPWYRSPAAYGGYAVSLGLAVWGLMRFRERRIRAQNERLESLVQSRTAELVKANAAKDEFLASVSHEIRNPMNGVIGISEALQTAGLDGESQRKFGMLRQCASHLSSLLEDILDFSKMQAGVIELEDRPFDLVELMDGVTAMTAADSDKYGIPVEVAISPAVPRHLRGDPRRVRQILLNFISNALKFAGRGQVSVTIWCKAQPRPDLVEVIFAVSDDGPGIAEEEQSRLFQRFERGAAARESHAPGTGLGLALCKGLAEKMSGQVWLESELGHGSSFHFSAPFRIEARAPEPEASAVPAGTGTKMETALVVDDQEYNRIALTDLLSTLGYRAEAAGDAAQALALAAAGNFSLVFLDYDLPDANGLEIARQLRQLPNRTAAARIFATTAFSTPEKQAECLAAGMNAFLGKPITLERLQRALKTSPPAAEAAPPAPPDPFENLRLLARKKGVSFPEELKLYVSELQVEMERLDESVARRDAREAAHYAHLLCGRFSFIHEAGLEQVARRLHEAAARGDWRDVEALTGRLPTLVRELQVRATSDAPAAPPA